MGGKLDALWLDTHFAHNAPNTHFAYDSALLRESARFARFCAHSPSLRTAPQATLLFLWFSSWNYPGGYALQALHEHAVDGWETGHVVNILYHGRKSFLFLKISGTKYCFRNTKHKFRNKKWCWQKTFLRRVGLFRRREPVENKRQRSSRPWHWSNATGLCRFVPSSFQLSSSPPGYETCMNSRACGGGGGARWLSVNAHENCVSDDKTPPSDDSHRSLIVLSHKRLSANNAHEREAPLPRSPLPSGLGIHGGHGEARAKRARGASSSWPVLTTTLKQSHSSIVGHSSIAAVRAPSIRLKSSLLATAGGKKGA